MRIMFTALSSVRTDASCIVAGEITILLNTIYIHDISKNYRATKTAYIIFDLPPTANFWDRHRGTTPYAYGTVMTSA